MNYTPETQWVGGAYPGLPPKHLHQDAHPALPIYGNRKAVIEFVTAHGPITSAAVAEGMGRLISSTRKHLQAAKKQGKLADEKGLHANGYNRVMYYSGVH